MNQTRTSAATSINSTRLPAVYNRFQFTPGTVVLDYGCGRYTDHIKKALPGCMYLPVDPYNQPQEVNDNSAALLHLVTLFHRCPVTVVCSNVLNVIDDAETVQAIANKLTEIAIGTGGKALVTVYEGDRTGTGRETGPDQWQRNERTRDYLRFFPAGRAHVTRNTIVIE